MDNKNIENNIEIIDKFYLFQKETSLSTLLREHILTNDESTVLHHLQTNTKEAMESVIFIVH